MSPAQDRMHQWRNIAHHHPERDAEIQRVNAMEEELGPFPAAAAHVRALISRFNSLSHYRAVDNLTLIVRAIGSGGYPGMPAVDVLWRHDRVDEDRRATFRRYYGAVQSWLAGETIEEAVDKRAASEELDEVYAAKKWLAASLAKMLGD